MPTRHPDPNIDPTSATARVNASVSILVASTATGLAIEPDDFVIEPFHPDLSLHAPSMPMHYFDSDSDSDSAPTTATNNSIANANLPVAGDNTSPQHALAIEPRVLITEPLRSDLSLPAPPMPMHRFDSESDSAPTSNANLSVAGGGTSQHALAIEPRVLITAPLRSDLRLLAPPMPMHHFDSESDSAPTSATANSIASANLSVAGDSTSQHALAIESRVFITEPRCSDLGP